MSGTKWITQKRDHNFDYCMNQNDIMHSPSSVLTPLSLCTTTEKVSWWNKKDLPARTKKTRQWSKRQSSSSSSSWSSSSDHSISLSSSFGCSMEFDENRLSEREEVFLIGERFLGGRRPPRRLLLRSCPSIWNSDNHDHYDDEEDADCVLNHVLDEQQDHKALDHDEHQKKTKAEKYHKDLLKDDLSLFHERLLKFQQRQAQPRQRRKRT